MNKYIEVITGNIERETLLGTLLAVTAVVLATILFIVLAGYMIILTINTNGLILLSFPAILAVWVYWEANKNE